MMFRVNREYAVGEVITRRSKPWRLFPDERWLVISVADAADWGWTSKPGEIINQYKQAMINSALKTFTDKYMIVIKEETGEEATAIYQMYKKK